jgi:hypothetical protein
MAAAPRSSDHLGLLRGCDTDDVTLGVGEYAECHPGNLLRRLNDSPTELICALQRGRHVLNADEE